VPASSAKFSNATQVFDSIMRHRLLNQVPGFLRPIYGLRLEFGSAIALAGCSPFDTFAVL
jgi:hypothetical protein